MSRRAIAPHRIAGNIALDLANTVSWRGSAAEVDYLRDAEAIRVWAVNAGLIGADHAIPPGDAPTLVKQVRNLRDAVQDVGTAVAAGYAPGAQALATIHDLAARSFAAARFDGVPASMAFATGDRIVGPLAWAAVDLLRGDELERLKQCPPDDCRWLFLDRTKNGSRRWCEMATCGNRAKKASRI